MDEGRELWKKYCAFFDKPFSEQLELAEKEKEALFEAWKDTQTAKHICPGGVDRFDDIPLTFYEDYPVLDEFGQKIEELTRTKPRGNGVSLWDYYDNISRQALPIVREWLPDEYGLCVKTSGTSGKSKWFAHGKQLYEKMANNIMAMVVIGASHEWGTTTINENDRIFGVGGPSPYILGLIAHVMLESGFNIHPPLDVLDNVTDMRKKIMISLKMIENGTRIDFAGGIASAFHLTCRYFTDRPSLYKDQYQSVNSIIPKTVLFFAWLFFSCFGKKYERGADVMSLKGIGTGGFDTEIYAPYLEEQFGVRPLNVYGASESIFMMIGLPERKLDLMPLMNGNYFEFLADDEKDEKVYKINELEKDRIYEIILTPFRSILARYRLGDLLKVVDFREDGLPIFRFESKVDDLLDIRVYFRLSEALATQILVDAGLPPTDKWVFVKEIDPDEHICLLMEKEWDYTEKEASQRIFDALHKIDPFFQNYVRDFGIKDPWRVFKVEYLKKGAFMRYIMYQAKQGVEMGQIKPVKLITPKKKWVADLLRRI